MLSDEAKQQVAIRDLHLANSSTAELVLPVEL
jgi:hypothetical protein